MEVVNNGGIPGNQSDSVGSSTHEVEIMTSSSQKRGIEQSAGGEGESDERDSKRRKGTAPIREEFLVPNEKHDGHADPRSGGNVPDDDAAEAFHHKDRQAESNTSKNKRREKGQGQNKARKFGTSRDEISLCSSRALTPEFTPEPCPYGEKCRFEHDLRKYLQHKREDLQTFDTVCPVWEVKGRCPNGWKCRFLQSHKKEVDHADGRQELFLVEDPTRIAKYASSAVSEEGETGVANAISSGDRIQLAKKKFRTPKSDEYLKWMDSITLNPKDQGRSKHNGGQDTTSNGNLRNSSSPEPPADSSEAKSETRATYKETPFRPSEKRRLYFGVETPVLAPLTTQGNLPFRRLCTSLGASFTYSEMAMSLPILQGQKSEWALMKAHESEVQPPTFTIKDQLNVVYDYDQSKDLRLGAQIAANKPWLALKATEVLTAMLPSGLRCVDLNVGCPIDLVYREGAGSALMDSPHKLEKMLKGMNAVSGEVPVTVKIRMGTKDKLPTAQKLVNRLVLGGEHHRNDPCGVAAITLHGRSRQQRYTRQADWGYIADTAVLIKKLNEEADSLADTIREPEERDQPNNHKGSKNGKVYFIGNGDVYSHTHYYDHIEHAKVDSVMAARGALIKPWVFEEITTGQYLDKTASERLQYVEKFCRYGLEAWGSDEIGVGQTRRFLLEWLSFACRYVPIGLLEYLPPSLQDRPPRYRGRNELETLMASDNYLDWIKIRYVSQLSPFGLPLLI